jgi:exonuclease SbcC
LKTFSDIKIKTTLSSDSLKLTTDTIENLNSQKRALQQNNLEIEKGLVSESKLTEINFWFENLNGFKNSEEDNVAKKIVIQEELGRFTQEFEMVFQSEIKEYFKSLNKGYSIVEFNITITQISNDLSKKLKEKRAELTHLKVQEELVKFSTNLEEGTPCDLCGSIHHPNPLSKEFSMSHLYAIEKEIEAIDNTEITLNELVQSIRFLFVKQENKQKELLLNKEELEKFQNLKNLHIQKVPDVAFNENDKEKFKVYFELATKQHNQLNQDRKQITSIEEEIQQKQDVKDVIQTELNQLYVAIASVEAKILMYRQGLKQLKEVDFIIVSIEEMIKNKEILKQEITNIEEDFKSLSTQSQELKVKLAEISVKIKMNIADGEKTKESLLDKNTQFISKLEGFKKTASEIESILSLNLNAQEIRNFIEENRKKFNMLQGEIKTLENQINSREFNEAQFREEQEKLSAISAELIALTQNKGRIESGIKETTIKLKEKKDLQRMYAEIELRSGNLKTLRRMFMSNGFVNFMSIRYLHNIVELANVRFQKMTKQQFKLTLKGKDNAFYVVDFLNGGKERSIKSLGGGQTFQACLALALALSENIQKLASIDQQFFFLDEGFGTLDKNAIELVFDTLKSLKNENRVVGLISHVEELQQEMDVFLKITNDAITGTVITESWK